MELPIYDKQKMQELLNSGVFPQAVAIDCDDLGQVRWYDENYIKGFIGTFQCPDWQNSRVEKEVVRWKPEFGGAYKIVDAYGKAHFGNWRNDAIDNKLYAIGNCYDPSTDDAERAAERVRKAYRGE